MFRLLSVSVVCLAFTSVFYAQTTTSLTGRVIDPSKALIVGARVAAISNGTN